MMVPTIPWPASPSEPQAATSPKRNRKKRKQLNNMNNADSDIGYHRDDDTDTDGVNRKVYSSLAELPCNNAPPPQPAKQPQQPPQQRKSKRKVRVNRDNDAINANAPKQKQRPIVLMNYVDDACCPQLLCGAKVHDEFCPHLLDNSNHVNNLFVSGNGNVFDRNNLPRSLGVHCVVSNSHTTSSSSTSTFASPHSPVSPGSFGESDSNRARRHQHQKQPPKPPPPPHPYDNDHCHDTHDAPKKKKNEKLSNNNKKTISDSATKSKSMTTSLRGRGNGNRQSDLLDKLINTAGRQDRMRVQDPPPRQSNHSKQKKNKNKNKSKSKNVNQRYQYRDFKNERQEGEHTHCNTEDNKRSKQEKTSIRTPKSNKKRQSALQDTNQALSPSMELKLNDLLSFGERMRK